MKITYKKSLFISIILFIVIWFVFNNSFLISRDELWYANYSIDFNDSQTEDIRHITEIDIHQVAFLPFFRIILKFFITVFGQNIYGLRIMNLIFGIIGIFFASLSFSKLKIKPYYTILLSLILSTFLSLSKYAYHARPDWMTGMLMLIIISLINIYLSTKKDKYLITAILTASLSASIYWSGLAVVAGVGFVLCFLAYKHIISFKKLLSFSFLLLTFTFLLFFIQTFNNFDALLGTFTNPELQTSQISNGNIFLKYPKAFYTMMFDSFSRGKSNLSFGLFTLIGVLLSFLFIKNKKESNDNKNNVLIACMLFLFGYSIFSAFRGGSEKFIFMASSVFLYFSLIAISFFQTKQLSKYTKLLFKLSFVYIIIFILFHSINIADYIIKNKNQWTTYKNYSNDIKNIIKDETPVVFTNYSNYLAFKNPKFYIENFPFQPPASEKEFNNTMSKYNIKYIIITERDRMRIEGDDENTTKYKWYLFLGQYLKNNGKHIENVYNPYYIKNKEKKYTDPRGFKNEIWEITTNDKTN